MDQPLRRIVHPFPSQLPWLLLLTAWLLPVCNAQAVPGFARQTGMSCIACHTAFPELTPTGRAFKLHGYTWTKKSDTSTDRLQEDPVAPLSAMLLVSYANTAKSQPGTQNGDVLLPDQFSLFYAGRISDSLGAFLQSTYDGGDDHFSMDNADIRIARDTELAGIPVSYGLSLNNNPTVSDLWNSTPSWGFPYTSSELAPAPLAAPVLDGGLAQQVAGLTAYTLWNHWVYAEAGAYRSSQIGAARPPDETSEEVIDGTAPYWRLGLQHQWGPHAAMVGTYGLSAHLFPQGTSGQTDDFIDYALDVQYQYLGSKNEFSVHSTLIHEDQDWNASVAAGDTSRDSSSLQTFRLDGSYLLDHRFGTTLGWFDTRGKRDALLYAPGPVDGSRTGRPDSRGWIAELDYLPWVNTKFALQFIGYDRFNGASHNYDGFGRDAADNDTLYLSAWFAF